MLEAGDRIYVDFDDVLCETAQALLRIAAEEFGVRQRFEEVHSFDLSEAFALTEVQKARLLDRLHEPALLAALAPIPGAVEGLCAWRRRGYDVDVVTGRPAFTRPGSERWLAAHGVPFSSLLFVDKYGRAGGGDTVPLAEIARRGYQLAVDDAPVMVTWLTRETDIPVFLFDRPWNRDGALPRDVAAAATRCHDWAEIDRRLP